MSGIVFSVGRDARRSPLPGHTSQRDAEGHSGRPGDKGIAALRAGIIAQARFNRRCFYCHVSLGTEAFEVHHLDGDHANDSPDNCVPVCFLCHLPWHLDLIVQQWPGEPGRIIFLPEMSQHELNSALYALFYHSFSTINAAADPAQADTEKREAAAVYERLQKRAEDVEFVNGVHVRPMLSQVNGAVRVLQEMNETDYERRDELLYGLRYLPPMSVMLAVAEQLGQPGAMFSRLGIATWQDVAGGGG